jgi:hypothetical protein
MVGQRRQHGRRRLDWISGDLIVVGVPKGSVWSLTLSDSPNPKTADSDIGVSDRRAALEAGCDPDSLAQASGPEGCALRPAGWRFAVGGRSVT